MFVGHLRAFCLWIMIMIHLHDGDPWAESLYRYLFILSAILLVFKPYITHVFWVVTSPISPKLIFIHDIVVVQFLPVLSVEVRHGRFRETSQ